MKHLLLSFLCLAAFVCPLLAVPFEQTLEGDGFSIRVSSGNAAEQNIIAIAPSGLKNVNDPFEVPAEGILSRAFLADMDGDNSSELFLVLTNPGSGSYGELLVYSTNGKKSLTPVVIEQPAVRDLAGYMGHDDFEVVENTLVRRFPVYKEGDANAAPSGGWRQFQYKLKPGEAAWQMKIDRVVSFGGGESGSASLSGGDIAPRAIGGTQMKYADNHGRYVYTFFEDGRYRFASMSQNETVADSREGRYTYAPGRDGAATITFEGEPAIQLKFSDPLGASGTIEGDVRVYQFRFLRPGGQ